MINLEIHYVLRSDNGAIVKVYPDSGEVAISFQPETAEAPTFGWALSASAAKALANMLARMAGQVEVAEEGR